VSYSGFSDVPDRMAAAVSRAAMADYRPPFGFVIDVLVDKGLGFNSCFAAYLDYVLSIHYYSLSFFNFFITSRIFILHLCRRKNLPVYSKKFSHFWYFFGPVT